jgi:hypothetical protein
MKRINAITKNILTFFICLIILTEAKAETAPAGDFLMSDGKINTFAVAGRQLTLDITGWNVELDPKRGPILSPITQPFVDTWSALDKGLNHLVRTIAVSGTDIYVGGLFTGVGIGGTAVSGLNYIAKWDGSSWSALDKGLSYQVFAIAVSGSDLYVGGAFTGVGPEGTVVSGLNYIAKWNGTVWSALDMGLGGLNGLTESVYTIVVNGADIYVGGNFSKVADGGNVVSGLNYIAKWNGTAWSSLDKGLNAVVWDIAVNGTDVYVGGQFTIVGTGGTEVSGLNYIAKWNGTEWSSLGSGLNGLGVFSIELNGLDLYVGGSFSNVGLGGTPVVGLNNIAKWNGSTWSSLDMGLNGQVWAITVSGSNLYIGGGFSSLSPEGTIISGLNHIAKWDGSTYTAFNMGLNTLVDAITVVGTDLYVGGAFNAEEGGTLESGFSKIVKWGTPIVLSVDLIDFKAQNTGLSNLLTWTTANEVNNKGFEIQRFNPLTNKWEILDFIVSKNKASEYKFTDINPLKTSYYRLRQIGYDGKEALSKTISISIKSNSKLRVYPSVATDFLNVETSETNDFVIVNLLGQVILSGKIIERIDISALLKGTYILKVGAEQVKFVRDNG